MQYAAENLTFALRAVLEDGQSIRRAANLHGVPYTILNDRVHGRVPIDCTKPGPSPILSQIEESKLVEHIKLMSSIGYGYSHSDVMKLRGEYLASMNKHEFNKPLSDKWFYKFMKRWPELIILQPSKLEMIRAKCTTPDIIEKYYEELHNILIKYDLLEKPECIYNIDEKGVSSEHKPPYIVGDANSKPQALTSPRFTTTVLACGNANGISIPPYFV